MAIRQQVELDHGREFTGSNAGAQWSQDPPTPIDSGFFVPNDRSLDGLGIFRMTIRQTTTWVQFRGDLLRLGSQQISVWGDDDAPRLSATRVRFTSGQVTAAAGLSYSVTATDTSHVDSGVVVRIPPTGSIADWRVAFADGSRTVNYALTLSQWVVVGQDSNYRYYYLHLGSFGSDLTYSYHTEHQTHSTQPIYNRGVPNNFKMTLHSPDIDSSIADLVLSGVAYQNRSSRNGLESQWNPTIESGDRDAWAVAVEAADPHDVVITLDAPDLTATNPANDPNAETGLNLRLGARTISKIYVGSREIVGLYVGDRQIS